LALAVALAMSVSAFPAARLKIGDKAPPIQVAKWIQGEPLKSFEKGKVYIVEYWATWCGPCKIYIPHLNKLHQAFKDKGLVVMGISIREDDPVDPVKYVKQMGNQMTYRVAADDMSSGKGFMDDAWMHAAETDSLPTSFIVNQDGLIAYIGHPIGIKEALLGKILAGKYDIKVAAAAFERKRENEGKIKELDAAYEVAMEKKDWAKAEETIDAREPLVEDEDRPTLQLARMTVKIRKSDFAGAEKIAADLLNEKIDEARIYDGLGWAIATEEKVSPKLLDLAEKSTTKASAMAEGKDPSIHETIARIQFLKGNKAAAIAAQEKAISLVPSTESERTKRRYQMALEAYRAGKLPE